MAGHSKWANIRHRKARQDAQRGKIFTRLIREIHVAARDGADPDANPRLRTALNKAMANNLGRDAIDRAIAKGSGAGASDALEEIVYEGYAPGGVALLVEAMTDNRNRAVAAVRHAFSKHGGAIGAEGSVAYLFERCGEFLIGAEHDGNRLMEIAVGADAEDFESLQDGYYVRVAPRHYHRLLQALESAGVAPKEAELTMRPTSEVALDAEAFAKAMKLVDALEDLDDTQNVHHNAKAPDG